MEMNHQELMAIIDELADASEIEEPATQSHGKTSG